MWSTLEIGKHAGRSLPQILFSDPDYFFWAVEKKIFQGRLATEAAELAWKVRHIKIPKPDPENWCVEYFFTPENKFSWYHLIESEGLRTWVPASLCDQTISICPLFVNYAVMTRAGTSASSKP